MPGRGFRKSDAIATGNLCQGLGDDAGDIEEADPSLKKELDGREIGSTARARAERYAHAEGYRVEYHDRREPRYRVRHGLA